MSTCDNRYEGEWREGQRHGRGFYTFSSGPVKRVDGIFKNNELEYSNCKVTYNNGDVYEGPVNGNQLGRYVWCLYMLL